MHVCKLWAVQSKKRFSLNSNKHGEVKLYNNSKERGLEKSPKSIIAEFSFLLIFCLSDHLTTPCGRLDPQAGNHWLKLELFRQSLLPYRCCSLSLPLSGWNNKEQGSSSATMRYVTSVSVTVGEHVTPASEAGYKYYYNISHCYLSTVKPNTTLYRWPWLHPCVITCILIQNC